MRKQTLIIFMFLVVAFGVFETNSAAESYDKNNTTQNNFKPAKRAMSFIKFSDAPENYGMRDARTLRKRYARYRSGRFSVTDTDASDCVDCQDRGDK